MFIVIANPVVPVDEYDRADSDEYDRADSEIGDEGEDECLVYNLERVFYLL